MNEWVKITLILCSFGFFRAFKPSEPFVTEFLTGEWRDVTTEQVNREVYPISTYSYLAQLVIVFLITDIVRYKPIIVLAAGLTVVLYSILIWTTSLQWLQVTQVLFGTYMSAEVAYLTYMYAKVDKDKYQKVTGYARGATQVGRFTASTLGQIIVSFNLMNLRELHYITLGAQGVAFLFSFLLPAVGASLYFYSTSKEPPLELNRLQGDQQEKDEVPAKEPKFSGKGALRLMFQHFLDAYTNHTVVQWSIWWALATAGFGLVHGYSQLLWQQIDPNLENFYNGGVEAILTFFAALSAFTAGLINSRFFEKFNMSILTVCSLLEGIFIIVASQAESVVLAYVMYVFFGTIYVFMITMASAMVAKQLVMDSFALIFGINTMVALVVQTIMTLTVVQNTTLRLTPREQQQIFGIYFLIVSAIFLLATLINFLIVRRRISKDVNKIDN